VPKNTSHIRKIRGGRGKSVDLYSWVIPHIQFL
jgi:hypothetical protein